MQRFMWRLAMVAIAVTLSTIHAHAIDMTWTRDTSSPVLVESSDMTRFDSGYIADPTIVHDSDTDRYFMYYTGCTDENRVNREALGLATAHSLDGPWTKYDGVGDRRALLTPGLPGDYDYNRNWGAGTIRKIGPNSWEMWTVGDEGIEDGHHVGRVGYATSTDGFHWTKYPGSEYGGAVLEDFSVTAAGIGTIAVLKEQDSYHAWYSMLGAASPIKHATSPNGTDWTIQGQVSLSGDIYSVDNVVKFGDTYYMATSRSSLEGIDFYTSTDKTNWTIFDGASLTPTGAGWDAIRAYQSGWYPVSETDWHLFYTGTDTNDDTQSVIGYAHATLKASDLIPQLNSSAFTWKYEFEGDTANTPDNLDIDGNSSPDMMGLGDPDGVVADGVMTLTQGAYIDDFGWKPELTDGIWKANSFSAANGFTIEARIKVVSSNETFGAIMIGAGPESQADAADSWLNIGSNEMTWNIDLPKNTLSSDDNTDDFHVFRLALNPETNCYDVWRDGVKVGSNLPDVYSPSYNGLDRLYLGDVSPSLDGTTIWDYVRFTEGYFEPESPEPSVPGDANGDGKVDGSDVTILAGNWQVGVDGTVEATWAMGDFNGDKKVDGSDVTILAGNWQYGVTASAAAVPEPSSPVLLSILVLLAIKFNLSCRFNSFRREKG